MMDKQERKDFLALLAGEGFTSDELSYITHGFDLLCNLIDDEETEASYVVEELLKYIRTDEHKKLVVRAMQVIEENE